MVQTLQIKSLIDYLELHPELARGRMTRTQEGRILSRKLWTDCATMLNAVCAEGPHKNADEWRLFLNEYKSKLFKKIKALKAAQEHTGNANLKSIYLTPLQERLFGLLGRDISDPFAAVRQKKLAPDDITIHLEVEEEEQIDSPTPACKESPPPSPSSPESSISSYWADPKKRHHDMSENITNEQNNTTDNNNNKQYKMNDNMPIKRHCSTSDNITNHQSDRNDSITHRQDSMNNITSLNMTNQVGVVLQQLDRFDYMAKMWAETLRILPNQQRIIAEKIINEVFFEAQLDTLTRESHLQVLNSSHPITTHIQIE